MVTFQKTCVFSAGEREGTGCNFDRENEYSIIWKSEPYMLDACLGKNTCVILDIAFYCKLCDFLSLRVPILEPKWGSGSQWGPI